MSIGTPLTKRLCISHPVLLAPMDVVADARLTAAVSAAGGFGILGGGYGDEHWLARELDLLEQSQARFGVGFITWSMAKQPRLLDLTLERKPAAVMLSFGGSYANAYAMFGVPALLVGTWLLAVRRARA